MLMSPFSNASLKVGKLLQNSKGNRLQCLTKNSKSTSPSTINRSSTKSYPRTLRNLWIIIIFQKRTKYWTMPSRYHHSLGLRSHWMSTTQIQRMKETQIYRKTGSITTRADISTKCSLRKMTLPKLKAMIPTMSSRKTIRWRHRRTRQMSISF